MFPAIWSLAVLALLSILGGLAAAVSEAGAPPSVGCHGEAEESPATADCHGRRLLASAKRSGRLEARAARSAGRAEGREDARAAKAANRSCHGSGGAGLTQPVGQSDRDQQSSPCDCEDGCPCRR